MYRESGSICHFAASEQRYFCCQNYLLCRRRLAFDVALNIVNEIRPGAFLPEPRAVTNWSLLSLNKVIYRWRGLNFAMGIRLCARAYVHTCSADSRQCTASNHNASTSCTKILISFSARAISTSLVKYFEPVKCNASDGIGRMAG